jgi:hypothetical protein
LILPKMAADREPGQSDWTARAAARAGRAALTPEGRPDGRPFQVRAPLKIIFARHRVTGETPPEKYELNYDKQENALYFLILLASALPAFLLWLF